MAAEPPVFVAGRKSESFAVLSDFQVPQHVTTLHGGLPDDAQFGSMIREIERVRSRFESEKSNSDQFSQQMRMVAQQIDSLASQQSSMLGFHMERIDSMLTNLKSSNVSIVKAKQRAFEATQRAKFEQERSERERLGRERMERERREFEEKLKSESRERERIVREQRAREEKERREAMEKLERERREREEIERKQHEQREHQEKMEGLRRASLPSITPTSMNMSDIIPQPSRTVKPSKRKLSLDLGAAHSALSAAAEHGSDAKRTKTSNSSDNACENNDLESMFRQFSANNTNASGASSPALEFGTADMDTSGDPPVANSENLPADIQEALKQQAMAMLQAQLAVEVPGASFASGQTFDLPADTTLPGEQATDLQMSGAFSTVVKPEPNAALPMPLPTSNAAATSATASSSSSSNPSPFSQIPVKSEPSPPVAAVKPEAPTPKAASKPRKKKPKKEVTPAVEDTTIADPMSVPLKNKAIHAWMSKDPERLYTADDICNAGIRYRSARTNERTGNQKGRVYVLNDRHEVRMVLKDKFNNKKHWLFTKGGWRVLNIEL